ncbi:uncharacterized protein [Tiliqua scincoides]|uniref:uncharacterized protein n=1 Tax=Tiliqua scincoides TaxID=71010 RepID=UPI003461AD9E
MDSVTAASTTFALDLFKKLSEDDPKKNLFFSPLSINSALSMVFQGAKGNTAAEMSKVLSVTRAGEINPGYEKLISEINKPGTKYLLRLANRLFGETSYDFLASFTDSCQKFYHADLEKLNFCAKAEESRKHINDWVEEKTAGKIQNLLAPGIINSLTRLVLVNAIYFKGNWANQFLRDRTMEKPFKISKNEKKMVQMMYKKAKFNMTYISDHCTTVLELPYVDNELSMVILLPDNIEDNSTGLEKLERDMTFEKLMDWINPEMMDLTEVELSLPKFKLEEKYDLKPVLSSMGMADAFVEGKADFSGMSPSKDLFLSEAVHKSFVEVNEEGTEAAAATAAVMMMRCAMRTPRVTADHPFLFLIRHNLTGSILFFGRFCSPTPCFWSFPIQLGFFLLVFGKERLLILYSVHQCFSNCGSGPTRWVVSQFQIFTMDKLANANAHFALDLFQKFSEADPTSNIFFSPLNISTALAMVSLGARGNTASQFAKILHFDAVEDVHSRFQALSTVINRSDAPYILKRANRLYGEKTCTFLQDFLTSTQTLYGAGLSTVDFLHASDCARKQINQWVEEQTEGKIPDLLSEGSVNELTKLVVVNAIYFKGSWAEKFQEEDTEDATFRLSKKEKKTVKMMFMKKKFPLGYIRECKCRVLELPYSQEELSMIILLPDDIEDDSTGLEQVTKQLTLAKLQEWTHPTKMYSNSEVYVHLPRFKLEESYDLKSHLSALGLLDVFDSGKANLSGMSEAQDLSLSKIIHKAFIEVNEEGTEAAAATAAAVMLCSLPMEEDFNVDHPFMLFIRHNPTKSILFCGKVASP